MIRAELEERIVEDSTSIIEVSIDDRAKDLYPKGVEDLTPATCGSIGYDLKADLDTTEIMIAPGERYTISTGIHIQPKKTNPITIAGFLYSRSGLGTKTGLVVAQGVGVIDPDYTGVIKVCLLNTSQTTAVVHRGDKIAQLVFHVVHTPMLSIVDTLIPTSRGDGGFGSTGV